MAILPIGRCRARPRRSHCVARRAARLAAARPGRDRAPLLGGPRRGGGCGRAEPHRGSSTEPKHACAWPATGGTRCRFGPAADPRPPLHSHSSRLPRWRHRDHRHRAPRPCTPALHWRRHPAAARPRGARIEARAARAAATPHGPCHRCRGRLVAVTTASAVLPRASDTSSAPRSAERRSLSLDTATPATTGGEQHRTHRRQRGSRDPVEPAPYRNRLEPRRARTTLALRHTTHRWSTRTPPMTTATDRCRSASTTTMAGA